MDINIIQRTSEQGVLSKLVVDLAPHFFWGAIIILGLFVIGPKQLRNAFLNARKIGFGGFEIELKAEISEAVKARDIDLPPQIRDQIARRLEQNRWILQGSRLLWIDDQPANNMIEMSILNKVGLSIDFACTDMEAGERLGSSVYDIVISDINRGGDSEAGIRFAPLISTSMLSPALIFYVGQTRDVPASAFGLTTRPDELLNLVVDAVIRRRG